MILSSTMVWNDEAVAPAIANGNRCLAYDDKGSLKTKVRTA